MPRRSKGEGSFYKRTDGRWCGKYADTNGKTRYVYAKTKAEVRQKLTQAIADRDQGIVIDSQNMTIAAYLDQWLDAIRGTVRERTHQRSEEVVRLHLKPTLGSVRLSNLTTLRIQAIYTQKLESGLTPRTVQIIHATLRKALSQAVGWSLVPRHAADGVLPPRPAKRAITPLTRDQIKTLLSAAQGERLYPLWVLLSTTGMRNGEALALKWSDVDLNTGTMHVRRSIFAGKINEPKTSSGSRVVKLSKMAVRVLSEHKNTADSEWIFSTSNGTRCSVHNIYNRQWKPLLKRAGLPASTRMHELRHTCISLLLMKGVPIKVVSEMAGHANIEITLSVYGHLRPHMQDSAADAIDDELD